MCSFHSIGAFLVLHLFHPWREKPNCCVAAKAEHYVKNVETGANCLSVFGVFTPQERLMILSISFFGILFIIEVKMHTTNTSFVISNVLPGCLLMPSLPLIVMRLTRLFIAFIIFYVLQLSQYWILPSCMRIASITQWTSQVWGPNSAGNGIDILCLIWQYSCQCRLIAILYWSQFFFSFFSPHSSSCIVFL